MQRPVGDLCTEIAQLSKDQGHELLSYLLQVAALEAYNSSLVANVTNIEADPSQKILGVWDWDVGNDLNHADVGCANLFGLDPVAAAHGVANSNYFRSLHPDDINRVVNDLQHSTSTGSRFESKYRVITGSRVRWVHAIGHCTLDVSRRPIRLPGVLIELSEELRPMQPALTREIDQERIE